MKNQEEMRPTIYLKENDPSSMIPYKITTNLEGEKILEGMGLGRVALLPNHCDDNLTIALIQDRMKLEGILGTINEDRQNLSERVYAFAVQYAQRHAESMPDPFDFVNEVGEVVDIKLRTL